MKLTYFFLKNLKILVLIAEILPLILCVVFFKKFQRKELKVFFFYECILFLFIVIDSIILPFYSIKQYYWVIIQVYLIIEYSLVSTFFYFLYQNTIVKKLTIIITFVYIFFNCSFFFYDHQTGFNYSIVLEVFLIILNSIYYFFEKIRKVDIEPIYFRLSFWIVVGFFLYASGNIFAFVYRENYIFEKSSLHQLAIIYGLVTLSKNLIFSSAIIFGKEPKKQQENISVPENLHLDDFPSNDNTA